MTTLERRIPGEGTTPERAVAAALIGRPFCVTCRVKPCASKGDGKWRSQCGWCRLKRMGRTRAAGKRHKDQCESCQLPFSAHPGFFDVDHRKPVARGGTNADENTWTLCPNCHRVKTLTERGLLPQGTPPTAWRQ